MDNKLQNIKSIYERRNTSNNIKTVKSNLTKTEEQENVEEMPQYEMKPRKSHVLDKVKFYEQKVRELEKLKNNNLLLGLAKKFGLSKYVDFSQPNDPKIAKNSPSNLKASNEADSFNLYQDFTTFLIEIQGIIENYEVKSNFDKVKHEETLKENRELKSIIEEIENKESSRLITNLACTPDLINEEYEKESYSLKQEIERLKQEITEKENIIKILQEQNTEYEHLIRFHQKDNNKETDSFRKDFTFGKFENMKETNFNQDNKYELFQQFSRKNNEKEFPQENKELITNPTLKNEENNKDLMKSESKDENNEKGNNLNQFDNLKNKNSCNLDSPVGNKENIRKENFYFDSSANSNDLEMYRPAGDESNIEKMKFHENSNSIKAFDENEEKEKPSVNNENIESNKDPKLTRDFKLNVTRESADSSFIDLYRKESYQGNEEDKFKGNESLSSQKITSNLDLNIELKKEEDESGKYKESLNREINSERKIEKEFNISINPKENSEFNPINEIRNPINHEQTQHNMKKDELEFSKEFNLELISDLLFTNYLLEGSLSLKKMNSILLDYFNLYLGTIFHRIEENNNFSYSILHEYLEDIFIRIYDIYLSNTFKNLQTSVNKEIWSISTNTISEELIDQIASNLFENNTLNITININKSNLLSFTHFKSQFVSKYRHYFPGKEEIFEKTIMENEIFNSKLIRMVQSNKDETISQIKEIINKCKSNINAGKIITRSIIYDYKKFYVEYFDLNKQNEEVFSFTDNLSCNKSIDSLVNSLKYKQNGKLKSLSISSNVQGKIEFPLGKLINAILFYARDLKHFSLTEAKSLNSVQQNILLRLLDLSNLSSLDLSHNMIGDPGIRLITDCLKLNNYSLKVLDISFNGLTSNSGYYLGELLYLNNTLEKLFLGGNNIIELGLHSMLNILSNNNKSLKTLDLSNNKLLHTDLSFISNLVSKNIALSTLNISMNSFESDSLSMLSESLKYNKYLKVLIMNQVNLNEDSSPYFLQHLNETNLSEIYLENNHLNEIGGILFSNIIKHNKWITKLSMKKCELNEMAISCIAKALESNNTMKYLNLEENKIDEETLGNLNTSVKGKNIKIYISMSTLKNTNICEEIQKSDNFMVIN